MVLASNPLLIFFQTSWSKSPQNTNNGDNNKNSPDNSNFSPPQSETNDVQPSDPANTITSTFHTNISSTQVRTLDTIEHILHFNYHATQSSSFFSLSLDSIPNQVGHDRADYITYGFLTESSSPTQPLAASQMQ